MDRQLRRLARKRNRRVGADFGAFRRKPLILPIIPNNSQFLTIKKRYYDLPILSWRINELVKEDSTGQS